MKIPPEYINKLIVSIKSLEKTTKQRISSIKTSLCSEFNFKKVPTNIEILNSCTKKERNFLKKYLITKPVRTISGVSPIAIMCAPKKCPHGTCTYCPGGPSSFFGNVPQSYTGNEPATLRAIRANYDPYIQIFNRLEQYIVSGHSPEKVEIIIMGGTFPAYPRLYKKDFITNVFKALNDFSREFYSKNGELKIKKFNSFFLLPGEVGNRERTKKIQGKIIKLKQNNPKSLKEEQKINETSRIRCIGLTIETRSKEGKLKEGNELLEYGCTRIELGIQSVYSKVLKKVNRGHTAKDNIESIRILRDLGFKLNFHYMPGLPGLSYKRDFEGALSLFKNPDYRPDMLKIYPCMVMPGTELYKDYKKGRFTPMTTEKAAEYIAELKKHIPKYCRVMRIQRDIPSTKVLAGVKKTNLRQYVEKITEKKGIKCKCIRCREIKNKKIKEIHFEIIKYRASKGTEYFISICSENNLIGFARMRYPSQVLRKEITKSSAIIRELHVYGTSVPLGKKEENKIQHKGFGSMLMKKAEEIALKDKKDKMLVISGVGVREYYKILGYKLEGPYMIKKLK